MKPLVHSTLPVFLTFCSTASIASAVPVTLLNGDSFVSPSTNTYATGDILVSGIGPQGNRSTYQFNRRLFFAADSASTSLSIEDGGLFTGRGVVLDKAGFGSQTSVVITVSGVNANGTPSEFKTDDTIIAFEPLSTTISVLGGGVFTTGRMITPNGQAAANITVSGMHSSGRRSTFRSGFLETTGDLTVTEGGLANIEQFILSSPDRLLVTEGGRMVSGSATVNGTVVLDSTPTRFRSKSVWVSDSIEVYGGTIDLKGGSDLRTGELAIRSGGNVLAEGYGTVRVGDVDVSEGGRLVINGSTLSFINSGTVLSGIDAGEMFIGERGARILAYSKNAPVVIDTSLEGSGGITFGTNTTIELTQGSIYQGGTVVEYGLLAANNTEGSATGTGDVLVMKRGILGGSGFIAGNVMNNGTVSPGNSPGTLNIGGNFTQAEDGTLLIDLESPQSFDVLKTGGKVIADGVLNVNSGPGVKFGDEFDIIQAGGGITGEFSDIQHSFSGRTRIRFVNSGGTGTVLIAPRSYQQMAKTYNERQMAAALDAWTDDERGDTRVVSENLDRLSAAEYRAAFSAISPALHAAGVATSIEQSQGQMTALNQHLNSRRLRPAMQNDAGNQWEAWTISTGAYSPGSMSSLAGEDYSAGNFIAGIERQVVPGITAGLFNSYGDSEGDFEGSNEIEEDRFTLGAHATAKHGGSYANTALGFGVLEMDVRRAIDFGNLSRRARSSTDGTEFFAMISGGHDFREGNWIFGPSASVQYSKVRYDDVKENGAGVLDLAVANPEDDSLRSQLGGRVAYLHKANEKLTLIPEARLFWQHEFLRDNETLDVAMEQGLGLGFAHQVADSDGDSVFTGVGLGFQTNFGFYGSVSYDIEIGRESDVNQTLSVAADWKF